MLIRLHKPMKRQPFSRGQAGKGQTVGDDPKLSRWKAQLSRANKRPTDTRSPLAVKASLCGSQLGKPEEPQAESGLQEPQRQKSLYRAQVNGTTVGTAISQPRPGPGLDGVWIHVPRSSHPGGERRIVRS
ncbi:hypothetical protein RF11_14877 [Thelohanellus kitauei]|uniref:Uncharacterized protein n=1 Tax=Thelohanellus kitauei TaxID=669202 RepID=A0A0C2M8R6_THEKT|nr:hypothetical protein RF11_14877 [Thelohanellus kitauei]